LYIIETNYFNVGGSKLKSVAGEFVTLFDFIKNKHRYMALFGLQMGLVGRVQGNHFEKRLTK